MGEGRKSISNGALFRKSNQIKSNQIRHYIIAEFTTFFHPFAVAQWKR
jgi:hypothetical protein